MGKPLPAPVEGDTLGRLRGRPDRRPSSTASSADPTRTLTARDTAARAPPRASSTTSTASAARSRQPRRPRWQPVCAATLARETHVSDPAAAAADQDPDQLLLLRRLRPRDPEEDPGRAAGRWIDGVARSDDHPALGRQRLDHLQQQGQAGPPVRAVLHRHAPLRVRRARSASARSCSTTRSSASSPRCTRTTPGRRWSSTRGGRRPGTSTTRVLIADPKTDARRRRLLQPRCRDADYLPTWHTWHAPAQRRRASDRTSEQGRGRKAARPRRHADRRPCRLARPRLPHRRAQQVQVQRHALDGSADRGVPRTRVDPRHRRQPARSARCDADDRPRRHALRLRHARQPHPPGQHGGGRALDAERRRRQAALRLGQPRPPVPHRLRRAAPADGRPSCAKADGAPRLLVGRTVYGESRSRIPKASNLRGKVVRASSTRRASSPATTTTSRATCCAAHAPAWRSDYKATLDWSGSRASCEAETFTSRTRYDALNRPIQLIAPHSDQPGASVNVIQPVYNEANLLERVDAWLNQTPSPRAARSRHREPARRSPTSTTTPRASGSGSTTATAPAPPTTTTR